MLFCRLAGAAFNFLSDFSSVNEGEGNAFMSLNNCHEMGVFIEKACSLIDISSFWYGILKLHDFGHFSMLY